MTEFLLICWLILFIAYGVWRYMVFRSMPDEHTQLMGESKGEDDG